MNTQYATYAAGCFWGVEATFRKIPGVLDVEVGYTGGTVVDPTYEQVCSGSTGHAEAVRITFDADVVGYEQLLDAFWGMHDPTTVDRQGPDMGSQYRSAIFYLNDKQRIGALRSRDGRAAHYDNPIVTEIVPATPFYCAEEYHQRFFEKQGGVCGV
ncbi:MAG: peptide-methionine (S)-S-oxide reductase MsrA [bacterium]|nr:peptide-methionine (S)-S-oxide reductase MsrA [bacterium]